MYLYLMTNPLTNIAGIYKITEKRIHDDTGYNIDMVQKIMKRFEQAKKAYREGEYIIIPTWPKHQKWREKDTINTGIKKILSELPISIRNKAIEVGYLYPIDTVPISYPYQPSYSDSDSDIDLDIHTASADDGKETNPRVKSETPEQFESFWQAYPRKLGKQDAVKKYKALLKAGITHETIMARLKVYQGQIDANHTEAQYIRHPSRFLNTLDDFERPVENTKPAVAETPDPVCIVVTDEMRAMLRRSYAQPEATKETDTNNA